MRFLNEKRIDAASLLTLPFGDKFIWLVPNFDANEFSLILAVFVHCLLNKVKVEINTSIAI